MHNIYISLVIVFKQHLKFISVIPFCAGVFYIVKNTHSRNKNQKSHFTMFLFPHWLVTSSLSHFLPGMKIGFLGHAVINMIF